MKNLMVKYIVVFALVIATGTMLLDVSQRVQEAEREIRRADRAIEREEENIRVLRAEWAYLNDPARLELISTSGLNMAVPSPENLLSDFQAITGDDELDAQSTVPSFVRTPARKPQNDMVRSISYNGGAQ